MADQIDPVRFDEYLGRLGRWLYAVLEQKISDEDASAPLIVDRVELIVPVASLRRDATAAQREACTRVLDRCRMKA